MTVRHPDAERDASPAAATVGSTTYRVDTDGIVECPPDEEAHVADVLAEAHDVPRDTLLTNSDGADAEALVDDGICPWCDDYEGDNVGLHASSAHADEWKAYKED